MPPWLTDAMIAAIAGVIGALITAGAKMRADHRSTEIEEDRTAFDVLQKAVERLQDEVNYLRDEVESLRQQVRDSHKEYRLLGEKYSAALQFIRRLLLLDGLPSALPDPPSLLVDDLAHEFDEPSARS